jgi:hypothetical protein
MKSVALILAGVLGSVGCGQECPENRDNWCDGDVVYHCTSRGTHGSVLVPSSDSISVVDDCGSRGGICRLQHDQPSCVLPKESCSSGQSSVCFNGDVHGCKDEHVLLSATDQCTETLPCTPDPSATFATSQRPDPLAGAHDLALRQPGIVAARRRSRFERPSPRRACSSTSRWVRRSDAFSFESRAPLSVMLTHHARGAGLNGKAT